MKATTKLFMMLLVVAGMLTFASCIKKYEPQQLPEKITISGQVTDKDGHSWEDVQVQMTSTTIMTPDMSLGDPVYTDENGHYEIEFKPDTAHSFRINFEIVKDGYKYSHSELVDKYKADQEINVVLKKDNE
jgi:hypothetical protein